MNNATVNTLNSGAFALDINLQSTQNNKLEITNNTFLNCCGSKSAIRIAQNSNAGYNNTSYGGRAQGYGIYSVL